MQPLLLRIDDRLLHGKVLIAWAAALRPARIVLASDDVAHDPERRAIYGAITAEDSEVAIEDLHDAAVLLRNPAAAHSIFVCGSPADVRRLHDAGGDFARVNLGGLHPGGEKRPLLPFAFLSRQDCDDLRALIASGVELEARELPRAPSVRVHSSELEALWT